MRTMLNNVDAYVGQQIRRRRMALGLSQEKLGAAVDLTFQQIQKYEKGANRVGASRLAQFAAILQVTPGWFFEGAPVPYSASGAPAQPTDDASGLLASREGLRLARAFLKIGDRAVQAKVADLVEVICRAPTAARDGAMAA